jgi:hypothetical protein
MCGTVGAVATTEHAPCGNHMLFRCDPFFVSTYEDE